MFVDAALSVSSAHLHPDETLVSPLSTPGVTDDPVRSRTTVGLIANDNDSMVEMFGAAISG